MKRKLIYLIALFLLMLVSGIFWGTWWTLTRSLSYFTSDEFVHLGKVIINNGSVWINILIPLCLVMMILSLWYYRYKRGTGFYLGLASFFLLIISLIITLAYMMPLERQITAWTNASTPPQWEYIRDQWSLFQTLRTVSTLASFGCFSWFILAAMKKNKTANY